VDWRVYQVPKPATVITAAPVGEQEDRDDAPLTSGGEGDDGIDFSVEHHNRTYQSFKP